MTLLEREIKWKTDTQANDNGTEKEGKISAEMWKFSSHVNIVVLLLGDDNEARWGKGFVFCRRARWGELSWAKIFMNFSSTLTTAAAKEDTSTFRVWWTRASLLHCVLGENCKVKMSWWYYTFHVNTKHNLQLSHRPKKQHIPRGKFSSH